VLLKEWMNLFLVPKDCFIIVLIKQYVTMFYYGVVINYS